jgi:hypothetical protein
MKQLKETGLIAGALVLFVAVVAGIFSLISSSLHDSPQVLYDFVISAKGLHDSIENTDFLPNIGVVLAALSGDSVENASEIEGMINEGRGIAHIYNENFDFLPPTRDTLELYSSLFRESKLISNCYASLNFAWSFKKSGDYASSEQYHASADDTYREILELRQKNSSDLVDWLQKAQSGLEK